MAAPVLATVGWGASLKFLADLIVDAEQRVLVEAALSRESESELTALVDLGGLTMEVVEWVKASIYAQFRVEHKKLVVFFRATGYKAAPSMSALEVHNASVAHKQASALLDFCFRRGVLEEADFADKKADHGIHALVRTFAPARMVKIQTLWTAHGRAQKKAAERALAGRAKKEAAERELAGAVNKLEEGEETGEKGKDEAAAPVGAKKEPEDSGIGVTTVYLRPKLGSVGGCDIDGILKQQEVGTLVEKVDGAYKVKTSSEKLQKLRDFFGEVADVEERGPAEGSVARTFAQQRAEQERVAAVEALLPREQLQAMQLLASRASDPLMRGLAEGLQVVSARREVLITRGEAIRADKKRRRDEAASELKEEEEDGAMAQPV